MLVTWFLPPSWYMPVFLFINPGGEFLTYAHSKF